MTEINENESKAKFRLYLVKNTPDSVDLYIKNAQSSPTLPYTHTDGLLRFKKRLIPHDSKDSFEAKARMENSVRKIKESIERINSLMLELKSAAKQLH